MFNQITLNRYETKYDAVLKNFSLPEEQAQFTGMPLEMLIKAKDDPERNPIVILEGAHPVGFFMLCTGELVTEYSSNQNALLLIAFSIDHPQQGRGYAKEGLKKLRDFITEDFPDKNEVVLAVNCRNIPAQKLYESVGFLDTGKRKMGKIGEQMILSLLL
ncbi:GNAT family N-acetyltransferase [Alkalihalobacillus sp. TS-13]|uniref:GNAT family N-acetyltransferase n=1 Tax=Alkalihalobacillus sp. TS-13 TaxID=2842455 RepID=UPI001C8868F8|nr:GNAT family N-acetyltransferase [Alkalihalobacillus sp. TS-13]